MRAIKTAIIGFLATGVLLTMLCAKQKSAELETGLSLFRQNKLSEALPHFQRAIIDEKNNSQAFAWLAETQRRLDDSEKALANAAKALEIDPCNSFAHIILAYAYNPMYGKWDKANRDSAWQHLKKAIACDSSDGNAWLAIWTEAIYHQDPDLEKKALHKLIETGFLTPAILAYNRWMLSYVPANGILLTNGDMDTYPAVALQEVEKYRTDVTIVNYSLLNTAWYARHIRDRYNIKLPFADNELNSLKPYQDDQGKLFTNASQIMHGWLQMYQAGNLANPITVAVTVGDTSFADDMQDHFQLAGAYKIWQKKIPQNDLDTSLIRVSLSSINIDDFGGPFVSEQDRSPIRIVFTKGVARNIIEIALNYVGLLIDSGNISAASSILEWSRQFVNKIDYASEYEDKLQKLSDKINEKQM